MAPILHIFNTNNSTDLQYIWVKFRWKSWVISTELQTDWWLIDFVMSNMLILEGIQINLVNCKMWQKKNIKTTKIIIIAIEIQTFKLRKSLAWIVARTIISNRQVMKWIFTIVLRKLIKTRDWRQSFYNSGNSENNNIKSYNR